MKINDLISNLYFAKELKSKFLEKNPIFESHNKKLQKYLITIDETTINNESNHQVVNCIKSMVHFQLNNPNNALHYISKAKNHSSSDSHYYSTHILNELESLIQTREIEGNPPIVKIVNLYESKKTKNSKMKPKDGQRTGQILIKHFKGNQYINIIDINILTTTINIDSLFKDVDHLFFLGHGNEKGLKLPKNKRLTVNDIRNNIEKNDRIKVFGIFGCKKNVYENLNLNETVFLSPFYDFVNYPGMESYITSFYKSFLKHSDIIKAHNSGNIASFLCFEDFGFKMILNQCKRIGLIN